MNKKNSLDKILQNRKVSLMREENFLQNLFIKDNFNNTTNVLKIDKNLLERIQNLLLKISHLDSNTLDRIFCIKNYEDIGTQTEIPLQIESKNFHFESEKTKLEKKHKILLHSIEENEHFTQGINNKLSQTDESLKKIFNENIRLKCEMENLVSENKSLLEKYHKLKDYAEKLEENFRIEKEIHNLTENFISTNPNDNEDILTRIVNSDTKYLMNITKYLTALDIINLKHCNSDFYNFIGTNHEINRLLLKYSISNTKKIPNTIEYIDKESNSDDDMYNFCRDCNIDLEFLIKKYSPMNESNNALLDKNRREFSKATLRSIEFVLDDIKRFTKTNNEYYNNANKNNNYYDNTNNNVNKNEKNILGSVGNLLKNVVNHLMIPTENTNLNLNNLNDSAGRFKDDEHISAIDQRSDDNFYFHSPLELRNLVYSTFFKLTNPYSTSTLNLYIEAISVTFSHLLFFAIYAVKELIEMRIVKNYLYEILSQLTKEKKESIKENQNLNRNINAIKHENKVLINEREEKKKLITRLKEEVEVWKETTVNEREKSILLNKKYDRVSLEYNEMNYFYKREFKNLQQDFITVKKERDDAVKMLINLKDIVVNKHEYGVDSK